MNATRAMTSKMRMNEKVAVKLIVLQHLFVSPHSPHLRQTRWKENPDYSEMGITRTKYTFSDQREKWQFLQHQFLEKLGSYR